jgi:hypothetical protein
MIKWFDADKFLPGRNVEEVLARVIRDNIVDEPIYWIAVYVSGEWESDTGTELEGEHIKVTHWAHINEPFE